MNTPEQFARALSATHLPSVFNPYGERCPVHDRPGADALRTRNLVRWLTAALASGVDTIWIARDLGYRGGRRTGLPLTDEIHLNQASALLGGVCFDRATRGPIVAERTAAIVWRVLGRIGIPAVLWNVFPLHPHAPNDPFSNRCHTRAEREATWQFLLALITMIQPRRLIAIGRDAALALDGINLPVHVVRHPSYGGQAEFIAGVYGIYGISEALSPAMTLDLPLTDPEGDAAAA